MNRAEQTTFSFADESTRVPVARPAPRLARQVQTDLEPRLNAPSSGTKPPGLCRMVRHDRHTRV